MPTKTIIKVTVEIDGKPVSYAVEADETLADKIEVSGKVFDRIRAELKEMVESMNVV